jgi:hypothetical protein
MDCELVSLGFRPGALKAALPELRSVVKEDPCLCGIFTTEFGNINELKLLRVLGDAPQAVAEADMHGLRLTERLGGIAATYAAERHTLAPFSPTPRPDIHGDVYELREYVVRPGMLGQAIEAWRTPFAWRAGLSTAIAVMHSTAGDRIKLVQIWAYRNYGHRALVRQAAVKSGHWPPPGGAERWLAQTTIALTPDEASPLR